MYIMTARHERRSSAGANELLVSCIAFHHEILREYSSILTMTQLLFVIVKPSVCNKERFEAWTSHFLELLSPPSYRSFPRTAAKVAFPFRATYPSRQPTSRCVFPLLAFQAATAGLTPNCHPSPAKKAQLFVTPRNLLL